MSETQLSTVPKSAEFLLQASKDQLEKALPAGFAVERFLRICVTELKKNEDLRKADGISFCSAVIQLAQLGLEPGAALGMAYLIPYKGLVEPQIGYKGYIALALRSDKISTIYTHAVYEGDEFAAKLGTHTEIVHVPHFKGSKLTHVYAVAKFKDGSLQVAVMSQGEVDVVRVQYSKQPKGKAWTNAYDEMAKKTVVRRLVKMLPVTAELADAFTMEKEHYVDVEATDTRLDTFKEVQEAEDVPTDLEEKTTQEQFLTLSQAAWVDKIATSDLYTNPELAVKSFDVSKLTAINDILKKRLEMHHGA